MKKKLIVICMLAMSLALTACGKEKVEDKKTEATTESKKDKDDKEEKKEEATETNAAKTDANKAVTRDFTLNYTDDWEFDEEDDLEDYEDYSRVELRVPDEENSYGKIFLRVSVVKNYAREFTNDMEDKGIDVYDAIVNGKGDKVTFAGREFFVGAAVDEYDTVEYFSYDEAANAFITLVVDNYEDDAELDKLAETVFDSIEFTLDTYTEDDVIPWYWEGKPYAKEPVTSTVGNYTIESKQIGFDELIRSNEVFDNRIVVTASGYYIYNGDKETLSKYNREGDTLKYDSDVATPYGDIDEMYADVNGSIYISSFGDDLTKLTDGAIESTLTGTDRVAVAPSGEWGVSYFSSGELELVNLADGSLTPKTFENVGTIQNITCTNENIFASVTDNDTNKAYMLITDKNFNEVARITSDDTTTDYYGSVTGVVQTANGYVIADGNMRDIYFLDNSFNVIGALDMYDSMGVNYPWPCSITTDADGNVILLCTDKRDDQSCTELVVFQLSGF